MPLQPLVRARARVRLIFVVRAALAAGVLLTGAASCGGSDGTAPVVTPVLTTVTVAAPAASLLGKQTTQLNAVTLDQTGKAMAATVSWSSSAAAVASVSATGLVTGGTAGTATVTASAVAGGVTRTATAAITVVDGVTSVVVSPPTLALVVGGTATLAATIVADPRAASTVTWTTSSAATATVSAVGAVTGVSAGTAQVCAVSTFDVAKQGCSAVTVSASTATVTSVVVTPASPSVARGSTVQLSAAVNGTNGPPSGVTWLSADVTKVTVSSAGLATGVAASPGTQVCATSTFDGTKSGCASVIVTVPTFPSVATMSAPGFVFSPTQVDIAVGGSVNFVFTNVTHNVVFNAAGAPANVPNTRDATVNRQFNTAGTFNIVCTLHSGMTGAVVVH